MSQILRSKKFGEIEVEHGGWQEGPVHIVRLTNGVYCHVDGLPIQSPQDFKKAGMRGDDLVMAENWFTHRHDAENCPPQGVIMKPDGSLILEDGTPVTNSAQLMQALPPGDFLDTALKSLFTWQEGQKAMKKVQVRVSEKRPVKAKQKTGAKKGRAPGRSSVAVSSSAAIPAV